MCVECVFIFIYVFITNNNISILICIFNMLYCNMIYYSVITYNNCNIIIIIFYLYILLIFFCRSKNFAEYYKMIYDVKIC